MPRLSMAAAQAAAISGCLGQVVAQHNGGGLGYHRIKEGGGVGVAQVRRHVGYFAARTAGAESHARLRGHVLESQYCHV